MVVTQEPEFSYRHTGKKLPAIPCRSFPPDSFVAMVVILELIPPSPSTFHLLISFLLLQLQHRRLFISPNLFIFSLIPSLGLSSGRLGTPIYRSHYIFCPMPFLKIISQPYVPMAIECPTEQLTGKRQSTAFSSLESKHLMWC